jgi:FkbM family methyltransferase
MELSDEMQRSIYAGGYELEETALVRRILGKGMTFVDVGANVGYYTALAAKLVGATGRVLSFEPCVAAFSKLQAMAGRCSHVQLFNLALGDADGLKALYVPPFEEHNLNPSMYEYRTDMAPTTVPVATLDKVLDGIDRVDLLKVDVEGYEPSIFSGAGKSMRSGKVRNILYESNPRMLALGGARTRDSIVKSRRWVLERLPAPAIKDRTPSPGT